MDYIYRTPSSSDLCNQCGVWNVDETCDCDASDDEEEEEEE